MKVILTAANSKLGNIGDIIDVKNGYAKNFLIPKKQAICFTESNYRVFGIKKDEFEKTNAANLDLASKIKATIDGKSITILQNASDDGRLYGSVNSSLIAAKINEIAGDKVISRSQIVLKSIIKEIGVYNALVVLHSEVHASVQLVIARSESEVKALLKASTKDTKAKGVKDSEVETEVAE